MFLSWLILTGSVLFLWMTCLWVVARRIDNYALVDVGWSFSFALVALLSLGLSGQSGTRSLVLTGLVVVWSLRLGSHLYFGRIRGKQEEGRYQTLRKAWRGQLGRKFFMFYQFQAVSVVILAAPFLLTLQSPVQELGILQWMALVLALISVAGESLADRQLQAFIADPANRGQVCRYGLWGWSRHPNYFFESLIWAAFALFALDAPFGWAAWSSPVLIWYLIVRVTGIPPTEAQCLKSRGEAYRTYQQQVSAFFPLPPRAVASP